MLQILYSLNEDGRRASLLDGGNGKAEQVINVPLDHPRFAECVALASVRADGEARVGVPGTCSEPFASIDDALDAIAAEKSRLVAVNRENEAAAALRAAKLSAVVIADPDAYAKSHGDPRWSHPPMSAEAKNAWQTAFDKLEATHAAERKAKEDEAASERAAKEASERQYTEARAEFVGQFGTDSQKARLKEGLLPADEADKLVRDHLFEPLGEMPRYQKLTAAELDHSEECSYSSSGHGEVKFSADDAKELGPDEYDNLVAIRSLMPKATVTPRIHKAVCQDDFCTDGYAERFSARVAVTWNNREFVREYAL